MQQVMIEIAPNPAALEKRINQRLSNLLKHDAGWRIVSMSFSTVQDSHGLGYAVAVLAELTKK